MIRHKIMIVDNDPDTRRLLNVYIAREGYETKTFQNGFDALDNMADFNPSLVLLAVMMPEMDGFEVLERIREYSKTPVIMLAARDWLDDKILGFELGADDYIVKPFEPLEVLARIKARLRNSTLHRGEVVQLNSISLDIPRNEAKVGNKMLSLKRKEIQLLQFMLNHLNIVLTREEIYKRIWDYDYSTGTRTVDMHIKRLREKLIYADAEVSINTIWGAGYKLVVKQ